MLFLEPFKCFVTLTAAVGLSKHNFVNDERVSASAFSVIKVKAVTNHFHLFKFLVTMCIHRATEGGKFFLVCPSSFIAFDEVLALQ